MLFCNSNAQIQCKRQHDFFYKTRSLPHMLLAQSSQFFLFDGVNPRNVRLDWKHLVAIDIFDQTATKYIHVVIVIYEPIATTGENL